MKEASETDAIPSKLTKYSSKFFSDHYQKCYWHKYNITIFASFVPLDKGKANKSKTSVFRT